MYKEYNGFMYVSESSKFWAKCMFGTISNSFRPRKCNLNHVAFKYMMDLSGLSGLYKVAFEYDVIDDCFRSINVLSEDLSLYDIKRLDVVFAIPGMYVLLEDGQKLGEGSSVYDLIRTYGFDNSHMECICIEVKALFVVPTNSGNPYVDMINETAEKVRRNYAEQEALAMFMDGSFISSI